MRGAIYSTPAGANGSLHFGCCKTLLLYPKSEEGNDALRSDGRRQSDLGNEHVLRYLPSALVQCVALADSADLGDAAEAELTGVGAGEGVETGADVSG